MKPEFRIDTAAFNKMCRELAGLTGVGQRDVIDSEVEKVIEKTISLIPAAKVGRIRANHDAAPVTAQPQGMYTPRTVAGVRTRARAKVTGNGKLKYWLANRYPNELWAKITEARGKSLKAKLAARGLAKKSMLMVARALGLSVKVPAYVDSAIATTGHEYPQDISVRRVTGPGVYAVAFNNAQPTVNLPSVRGKSALQRAINGRVNYFKTNVRKKVFEKIESIALRYPGLRVNKS